jgi:exodeoxyribonuclease VII large subunit
VRPEDLFHENRPAVLTVTQVNQQVRRLIETHLMPLAVQGEISNLKVVSGHAYFVLKDDQGQLPAVLFRVRTLRLAIEPKDGMAVVARGRLTLYVPYGRYQLIVESLTPAGVGAMQAAFVELKEKLKQEGLFAQERKRRLPSLPQGVAVVASPTGAVIRDIVHVATRRFPRANILLVPARVQGAEAPESIVAAIARANAVAKQFRLDVLILARGGGSIEDLWAFNTEPVARAIFASDLPVVSAVGHETDFTIADFVADLRAPTPSAAAELVFPVAQDLLSRIQQPVSKARAALRREIQIERHRLRAGRAALGNGAWLVEDRMQRLDAMEQRLGQAMERKSAIARLGLSRASTRLEGLHPRTRVLAQRAAIEHFETFVLAKMRQIAALDRARLNGLSERVRTLGPTSVLARGYSLTFAADGTLVRDASTLERGDALSIVLARGRLGASVERIEP